MKDLEHLEKKNKESPKANKTAFTPIRKKNPALSTGSQRKPVDYEDKIKELEAKLFGS